MMWWLLQAQDEFTDADADFQKVVTAKKLDRYYIPMRYPNGLPGGAPSRYFDDPLEAEEAMRLARDLMDLVERNLGKPEA